VIPEYKLPESSWLGKEYREEKPLCSSNEGAAEGKSEFYLRL